ncbi:MAG: hypothetical protein D6798_02585 [Deltaproteobacteria bacterium]|nr:MAG: hypothetical protein D6798_02585 [Deltaproteobacteria bacterium]
MFRPAQITAGLLFVATMPTLVGCGDKDDDGDDGGVGDGGVADDGGAADSGAGDSAEPEPIHGTVTGRITVELYDYQTGDAVSWDEYDSFPFGPIFVAAYKEVTDDKGETRLEYKGQTALLAPTPSSEGDEFEVNVTLQVEGNVHFYAALDWDRDTVIGSDEPRGVYPSAVAIEDGGTVEDVDMTIVAPVNTGGGSCEATTEIRGEALITSTWVDGDVAVMTTTVDGIGPIHSTRLTPTPDGAGASGNYVLTVCAGTGQNNLIGAWDSNGNEILDPADRWGTYLSAPDTDGNPITIGSTVLKDHLVQIPYGDAGGLSVYPFVSASGTLTWAGGSFDGLPAGTIIHALALKYRPSGDVAVADLEAYDQVTWTEAEFAGRTSLDWELGLPINSVAFLWFYADTDGDGVVNEVDEPVGSAGSSDGRFPTGTTSSTGIEVELSTGG